MKKLCMVAGVCAVVGLSSQAHAFNLGYHRDITVDVLRHEGFSEAAINVVLAGNMTTDILQEDNSYKIIDDDVQDKAQKIAQHLHFDQAYRPELIQKNFEFLVRNARTTLLSDYNFASTSLLTSQELVLLALGISLHAIQDFYAHANWANLGIDDFVSVPADATYFDLVAGQPGILEEAIDDYVALEMPRASFGLFTHWSSDRVPLAGTMGTMFVPSPAPKHADLCKDWATRAFFDEAYRAAYKASLQWVRFFEHIVVDPPPSECTTTMPAIEDPLYWQDLKAFTQAPQDQDKLDEIASFVGLGGTAHFMAQYGGAWKEPDRWAWNEILLHDLPNSDGFGFLEQLGPLFEEPALMGIWVNSSLQIGDHLLEAIEFSPTLDQIVVSHISASSPAEHKTVFGVPFSSLPSTNTCEIDADIEWLGTESTSDYAPNWVKVAAPFNRDNDNGDGWWNFNDEDPGATSDYYAIWRHGTDSGPHTDYHEAINRDRAQSYSNWQVLLPLWTAPTAPLTMQFWESDQVDTFDAFFGLLPFVSPGDDLMDINPQNGDHLSFLVHREPFAVNGAPNGVRIEARPYGALIRTSGNDDDTFGDYTASVDFHASPIARPTRVQLTVFEVGGVYVPRGTTCSAAALPGCETQLPALFKDSGLTINATINQHVRRISHADLKASDTFNVLANTPNVPPQGGFLQIETEPSWNVTWEGYVDSNTIPITFEITSNSLDKFRIPQQGGRVELLYDLASETFTGNVGPHDISGVNGSDNNFFQGSGGITFQSFRWRLTVDSGVFGAMPPPQQVVEYFCADPQSPTDNHIRPRLRIRNVGAEAVPLSEYKIRYWYSSEGLQPEQSSLDYVDPSIGQDNVTRSFRKLRPLTGADGFMELGFTPAAGNLPPNATTGEIQLRFNKGDWSNYHEPGDYSSAPTKTTFAEWNKVTLYRNNVLIFGTEPTPIAESQIVRSVDVFIKDEGIGENNIVKPRFYLVNTGNVTLPRLHVRYHFTVENGKTPVLERWHLPDVTATLQDLGSNHWVVDYRFEGLSFGPGVVVPDAQGFVSGIHYSDYGFFDKSNDFSNPGTGSFVKASNIEVTFD